jgi:hypothetical protein
MNKQPRILAIPLLILSLLLAAQVASAQGRKNSAGEEFFIVSSVDAAKSQLLLKRPTEVTEIVTVNAQTILLGEDKKPIHFSDLRAGDTVWVVLAEANGAATAKSIRKGPMTVSELHALFLGYPEIK